MSAEDLLLSAGRLIGCIASCGPYVSGEPGEAGCASEPVAPGADGLRLPCVGGVLPYAQTNYRHGMSSAEMRMPGVRRTRAICARLDCYHVR